MKLSGNLSPGHCLLLTGTFLANEILEVSEFIPVYPH